MASMYTTHQASGAKRLGNFSDPDNIHVDTNASTVIACIFLAWY